jgi:hypothetical protein
MIPYQVHEYPVDMTKRWWIVPAAYLGIVVLAWIVPKRRER